MLCARARRMSTAAVNVASFSGRIASLAALQALEKSGAGCDVT